MSQFTLGEKSLKELQGVHPDLVAVVKRAIAITVVRAGSRSTDIYGFRCADW